MKYIVAIAFMFIVGCSTVPAEKEVCKDKYEHLKGHCSLIKH